MKANGVDLKIKEKYTWCVISLGTDFGGSTEVQGDLTKNSFYSESKIL